MPSTTTSGIIVSFGNTPQAVDDYFSSTRTGLTEDVLKIVYLDVMANDLGGAAKTLYSVDDGTNSSTDLLKKDVTYIDANTAEGVAGTSDVSSNGARLWITADGKIGYDANTYSDAFKAQVNALSAGEFATDTFTYAIRLGNGTLSWATATVQIAGMNDNAVVSGQYGGAVVEDRDGRGVGTEVATGALTFSDVDLHDHHTITAIAPSAATLGSLNAWVTRDTTGTGTGGGIQWSYSVADSAINSLGAGETRVENFSVSLFDGTSTVTKQIAITITGTNDNAIITGQGVGAVVEDQQGHGTGNETASGTLTFTDADLTDHHAVNGVTRSPGALGTLTAWVSHDTTGSGTGGEIKWSYTVDDGAIAHLAAGQAKVETFTVSLFDGTSTVTKEVSISITGTNDAPVVSAAVTGNVTEDGTTGTLDALAHASDVDNGTTLRVVDVPGTLPSGVTFDAATHRFMLDPSNAAYQHLAQGQTTTVTVSYGVSDGIATTPASVAFTVMGTNDAPIITSAEQRGTVKEDTTLMATGKVASSDVDHGATAAYSGNASGTYGSFAVNASTGVWTYTLDNASHQNLAAGETQHETFTVTVTDDQGATATQDVVLTITGTNDAPVITSGAQSGTVKEDATLVATGTVTSSDVDHGAIAAYSGNASGTYGSFAVNASTGVWTYTLDDASHQNLAAGETQSETFTVTVTDDQGATATQDVVLTITGTNDAPVITSAAQAGVVKEDAALIATGTVTSSDVDHGATAAYSGDATGTYGSFAVDASTGVWTYTLDNASHQNLSAGETQHETFTVTVTDDQGATATQDVVLTITGTNDAPVITSRAQSGTVKEDATLVATGTVSSSDVDHGATAAYSGNASGTYGSFAVNASTGVWTYTLDNANHQNLAQGESQSETFTVMVTDDKGATATQDVVLTITGTNDAPVITSAAQAGSVKEDTQLTATGTVTSSDVDHGATATYSGAASGSYGSFAVNASTGVWTYTLDNAAHQNLAAGETQHETFTVTVTDDQGATATQDVVLTITGTNDAPVITSAAQAGSVKEDAQLTATGTVTSSDVDHGATATYSGAATGSYGSFAVNASTGVWTYTLDNASHQNLSAGETQHETFTVTVTDDRGATATQDVVLTITGTNDAPVITSGAQSGTVKEDATLVATGTVASSDVDHRATAAYSGNASGTYGSFAVNASTGVWTYTLDNASHQNLAAGETQHETFTVTVTDDQGATATQDVVLTITGTNDAPVITSAAQAGSVKEDTQLTASGTVTSSDVDHGATATYSGAASGSYGSFAVNASTGVWTYTLDNAAHQNLAAGETQSEIFTVAVTDDQGATATQDVVLTITGTNDAPVITSGAQSGTVKEDATLVATGTVTSSDVDHGATAAYSGNATGTYGSFAVNSSTGEWTYTLDNASHQNLAAGETQHETFTVTVTDDQGATATQDVVLTITGTNDAPVITSGAQAGAVKEDTQLTATGTVTSSDVDHGATAAYSGNATGTYGSFAVDASTGVWTYTLDNASHQNLAAGETQSETFTVTVTDDQGATATQDVVLTITGANDAPVITSAAQAGSVKEDSQLTATGTVTSSDVDHGATATYSGAATGTYGSFAVNASTGVWTYTLDNASHQNLAAGETQHETFTVTVTDDRGATATQDVVLTITGTNDAPVITSGAQSGTVKEDATLLATGTVASSDVDHGATTAYSGNASGMYGSFAVNASTGVWTYTLDNASHQNLAAGETQHETFTVTVTDDQGATATQDVVLTITGTNDAPVITSAAQAGSVKEDTQLTATGTVTSSDVDHGATATYSGAATGTYGSFAVNASTGVWTYTLDNASHQNLAAGETQHETFTVTVTDDQGATASQDVVLTITGTNDAPVITSGAQSGTVKEDTTLVATGTVTSSDVDHGATAAYSGNATGTYGSFAVNASTGVWTYTLDNANHQNLAQGESQSETFTVMVTDDKGATATQNVVLTITGTNDAPVITSGSSANASENSPSTTVVYTAAAQDADAGDTVFTFNLSGTDAGLFDINASTGAVTFKASPNFEAPADANHDNVYNITVSATDAHGLAGAAQAVSISVTNVNEAPTITSPASASTPENVATSTAVYTVAATDPDAGTTLSYAITGTDAALFNVNSSTGAVTFKTSPNFEAPTDSGGNNVYDIVVHANDGTNDTTRAVAITVTNVNEAPTITSPASASTPENVATSTAVYTVAATDPDAGTTLSYAITGTDAALFNVNSSTGAVTFKTSPNFEAPTDNGGNNVYDILVHANDGTNDTTTAVAITVTDVVESDPNDNDGLVASPYTPASDNPGLQSQSNPTIYYAGAGNDTMTGKTSGNAGNNVVTFYGGSGNDTLNGSNGSDFLYGGSGTDTINGNDGNDRIVGGFGADTLSGGAGTDTFVYLAIEDAGDHITDFDAGTSSTAVDKLEFTVTSNRFAIGNINTVVDNFKLGNDAAINVAGTEIGVKTDAAVSTAAVQSTINGFTNITTGALFVVFNSTVGHAQVYYDPNPSVAGGAVLIADLDNLTTLASLTNFNAGDFAFGIATAPAGTAGEPINLGLSDPSAQLAGPVTVTVTNVPGDWVVNGATKLADGSWTVQTVDPGSLAVTTPTSYVGAMVLGINLSWTNADGTTGTQTVADNVEAYAPGSPIFAVSADDNLTASSAADLLVFAQPIAHDVVHNFDASADKIDLIGFAGVSGFDNLSIADDVSGNAVITTGCDSTITVIGVHAADLTATNFEFNLEPVTVNSGTMTIANGAILPLGGVIENSGTIAIGSTGAETDLQILVESVTLQGGGHVVLSDDSSNVIFGGAANATLINVDNTISGAGQVGAGHMALVNAGTIIADGSHALVIDTGASVVTNSGTLEATGSGGLVVEGAIANSGSLWANGGEVTVRGDVTGHGSASISGRGAIEFGSASDANVGFASDAVGTLTLDHAAGFTGTLTGLNADDVLHFGDIAFSASTQLSYTANAAGTAGSLVVSDGTHTAQLTLVGQYSAADFQLAPDQSGNVSVLNTADGNTTVLGTAGADVLTGSGSNDVIVGSAGSDVLTGGAGSDTFMFLPSDTRAVDTVTDFDVSPGGDVLNVGLLLQGYSSGADLSQFISLRESGGSTIVSIDSDGAASAHGFQDLLVMQGVTGLDFSTLIAHVDATPLP